MEIASLILTGLSSSRPRQHEAGTNPRTACNTARMFRFIGFPLHLSDEGWSHSIAELLEKGEPTCSRFFWVRRGSGPGHDSFPRKVWVVLDLANLLDMALGVRRDLQHPLPAIDHLSISETVGPHVVIGGLDVFDHGGA